MNTRILVAGIGNIFLGDDAFGVKAAQALARRPLPEGVAVHDFGIRCLDLAFMLLDDWDHAVLLDAAARGGEPGCLYRIDLDDAPHPETEDIQPHSTTVEQVRGLARRMAAQVPGKLPRMILVGCEPASLEPTGGELSPPVADALPSAVAMIEALIHELNPASPLEVTAA
ncbi:MAG TPA: hydrogenase maturation protease [Terriglobales bacterium]|nr:hydrogenase maturation protease [Terriglobales bacterium]